MRPESGFRMGPNWPCIEKITMTSQFADMTFSLNFFDVVLFPLSSLLLLLVQVLCQHN